jgi:hypothetical protein
MPKTRLSAFSLTSAIRHPICEKWAARDCKRPKSREETPKEGGGNAKRYRTAANWHRTAKKAREPGRLGHAIMQNCAPSATILR